MHSRTLEKLTPTRPTKQPLDVSEKAHSGVMGLGLGVTAVWGSGVGDRIRAGVQIHEMD